jgi:hypothetical protein
VSIILDLMHGISVLSTGHFFKGGHFSNIIWLRSGDLQNNIAQNFTRNNLYGFVFCTWLTENYDVN